MEVVSKDDPDRDKVDKRKQYARAGISEYWIVDPHDKSIIVLRLKKDRYVTHSRAIASGVVRSALLDGFIADAAAVFAAGKRA
jgi:Uma2 family endonuclease